MEQLSKVDLAEAVAPIHAKLERPHKDVGLAQKDISLIHEVLVAHDTRANEMLEMLRELSRVDKLTEKVERIERALREKLNVEV